MNSSKRVVVEGLSKKFSLSTRDSLKYGLKDSIRRLTGRQVQTELRDGEFWALRDVSFELDQGDSLGMMGVNGSGKTTLLRILNSTYKPDRGRAVLSGQIGSLIAAGAGFAPLLSGRENIFINGTLLGMHPKEIRDKLDEIIAFSGLEEFIDMPVKNYSSGMSVKLGFSIATIGTPDILLVDEVLAVGDVSFQKKCFEKINNLKSQGTTIILVSHAVGAIWSACNKGLVLRNGMTNGIESVEDACRRYEDHNSKESLDSSAHSYKGALNSSNQITVNCESESSREYQFGEDIYLNLLIEIDQVINNGIIRLLIDSEVHKGVIVIDNYEISQQFLKLRRGTNQVKVRLVNPQLRPGSYSVGAAIIDHAIGVHLVANNKIASFMVANSSHKFFFADPRAVVQVEAVYET